VTEIFPSLLKQRKWYKREAKVGNVVLRKDETAAAKHTNTQELLVYTSGWMELFRITVEAAESR
jgi:hypothetical protein